MIGGLLNMTVRQQDLISPSLILHVTVNMKAKVGECPGTLTGEFSRLGENCTNV